MTTKPSRITSTKFFLLATILGASLFASSCASLPGAHAPRNPASTVSREKNLPRYDEYRRDTEESLERMRNPASALLRDKILVESAPDGSFSMSVLNPNTSVTNIGLDLLNQISARADPATATRAEANIQGLLRSLAKMDFHRPSGLFYSWYSTETDLRAVVKDVSSVDNIHLALALWTVRETLAGTRMAREASRLFARMDFSIFYDDRTGLFWGNLKSNGKKWETESYHFSNFGSEARSIYAVTWALDLVKNARDPKFIEKSVASLTMETFPWSEDGKIRPILRTWDGGAFQLLLPKLLLNEELYSEELGNSFRNYSRYILREGDRLGYPVPAAFSASNFGIDGRADFEKVPAYEGKSGSLDLVSTSHEEAFEPLARERWGSVFTPHAAMLAATTDPETYVSIFRSIEDVGVGKERLYRPGWGFMDGFHVKGPYAGKAVPVLLSLDQGMIAMALYQIKAVDGLSPSGKALWNNPFVRKRLGRFYSAVDAKLVKISADNQDRVRTDR
jgi:hypothetical protein